MTRKSIKSALEIISFFWSRLRVMPEVIGRNERIESEPLQFKVSLLRYITHVQEKKRETKDVVAIRELQRLEPVGWTTVQGPPQKPDLYKIIEEPAV